MSALTIFYQECPICGRKLRIPAKFFGRLMTCTHCEGEFRAGKEELPAATRPSDPDVAPGMLAPGVFPHPQLGEV
jgi:hypothetical protein